MALTNRNYPKCYKTYKEILPSKAAAQAEIILNKLSETNFYQCKFCKGYHFTSSDTNRPTKLLSLYRMFRRLVIEGNATLIEDISIDSIKYQVRFDSFTYTFLYNPKNEHIEIIDKQ